MPGQSHQTTVSYQAVGQMPVGEVAQRVRSHQKKKLGASRQAVAHQAHHVNRVVRARAVDIHPREMEMGVAGQGCLHHAHAAGGGRQTPIAFVRRIACRHDHDAIEFELKPGLFSQNEVSNVGRIKRAAENSYAHSFSIQAVLVGVASPKGHGLVAGHAKCHRRPQV